MNSEQIQALAADLRVRQRTETLCAVLNLNPLRDREQVELLIQELLDVAMEGWLSAKVLGR